jgi:hypothetical protein
MKYSYEFFFMNGLHEGKQIIKTKCGKRILNFRNNYLHGRQCYSYNNLSENKYYFNMIPVTKEQFMINQTDEITTIRQYLLESITHNKDLISIVIEFHGTIKYYTDY